MHVIKKHIVRSLLIVISVVCVFYQATLAEEELEVKVEFIINENAGGSVILEATGVGYYPAGVWDKILRQKQILEHKKVAERVAALMAYQIITNVIGTHQRYFDMGSIALDDSGFIKGIRIVRNISREEASPAVFMTLGLKVDLAGGMTTDNLSRDGWAMKKGDVRLSEKAIPLTNKLFRELSQNIIITDLEETSMSVRPSLVAE